MSYNSGLSLRSTACLPITQSFVLFFISIFTYFSFSPSIHLFLCVCRWLFNSVKNKRPIKHILREMMCICATLFLKHIRRCPNAKVPKQFLIWMLSFNTTKSFRTPPAGVSDFKLWENLLRCLTLGDTFCHCDGGWAARSACRHHSADAEAAAAAAAAPTHG